jgi:TPR repeat protein
MADVKIEDLASNKAWKEITSWGDDNIQKLAKQGNMYAQAILIFHYAKHRNQHDQIEEAKKWLKELKKHTDPIAIRLAEGSDLLWGLEVVKNQEKAVEIFKDLAKKEDPWAQFQLGRCNEKGYGVLRDFINTFFWYRKAANRENAVAQYYLGKCYVYLTIRSEEDLKQAVFWYQTSAEQNYVRAQYTLGLCYKTGLGVEENPAQAICWYRKAAEDEYALAEYQVGKAYEKGKGVEKDDEEAVCWYRKAAEHGLVKAQLKLGSAYYYGLGVEKKFKSAAKWFKKAADHEVIDQKEFEIIRSWRENDIQNLAKEGNIYAQIMLAHDYARNQGQEKAKQYLTLLKKQLFTLTKFLSGVDKLWGLDTTQNQDEAVKIFSELATEGNSWAELQLGKCYASGQGVETSLAKAASCYKKAANLDQVVVDQATPSDNKKSSKVTAVFRNGNENEKSQSSSSSGQIQDLPKFTDEQEAQGNEGKKAKTFLEVPSQLNSAANSSRLDTRREWKAQKEKLQLQQDISHATSTRMSSPGTWGERKAQESKLQLRQSITSYLQEIATAWSEGKYDVVHTVLAKVTELCQTLEKEYQTSCPEEMKQITLYSSKLEEKKAEREKQLQIVFAARNGQLEKLRELIKEGADLNVADDEGMTALHYTAQKGNIEAVKLLLSGLETKKLDLNVLNKERKTALHLAIEAGEVATAELLASVTSSDIPDGQGKTAMQLADEKGYSTVFNALVINTSPVPEIPYQNLTIKKAISKGGYGAVYQGSCSSLPDTEIAIKELLQVTKEQEKKFEDEAKLMYTLRHINIITFYGITRNAQKGLCVVMKYAARGSLGNLLHDIPQGKTEPEKVSWELSLKIAKEIGRGLSYLHSREICHRDLKSYNVLLTEDYRAKLCDFGLSSGGSIAGGVLADVQSAGTLRWTDPDLLDFEKPVKYTKKCDIYSYGMVMFELAARELPYHEIDKLAEDNDVSKTRAEFFLKGKIKNSQKPTIPQSCPARLRELIQKCWGKNDDRPTAEEVVSALSLVENDLPEAKKDKSDKEDVNSTSSSASKSVSSSSSSSSSQ